MRTILHNYILCCIMQWPRLLTYTRTQLDAGGIQTTVFMSLISKWLTQLDIAMKEASVCTDCRVVYDYSVDIKALAMGWWRVSPCGIDSASGLGQAPPTIVLDRARSAFVGTSALHAHAYSALAF